jgi:hypothetical protein
MAVYSGNTQMVNLIKTNLEYFDEIVNIKEEISTLEGTALIHASLNKDLDMAKVLLNSGA